MAEIGVKVTTGLDDLVQQLVKTLTDRSDIEAFRKKVGKLVDREITRAAELSRDDFNPRRHGGDELVGQLGIGIGGQPSLDKMSKAWLLLVPGSSSVKLSSTFAPSNLKKFGTFNYSVDIEHFYDRDITNYISTRSSPQNNGKPIPWMRYFIEGMEFGAPVGYIDSSHPQFKEEKSRTGIGHMLPLENAKTPIPPQFSWDGVKRAATFGKLEDRIARRFRTAKFRKELAAIFASSIGS